MPLPVSADQAKAGQGGGCLAGAERDQLLGTRRAPVKVLLHRGPVAGVQSAQYEFRQVRSDVLAQKISLPVVPASLTPRAKGADVGSAKPVFTDEINPG